ncbi:hypothetical protein T05_14973 [Trichinella murrelli]|uniref:Uncharacterized protein n=1 Tax=Trichinella murrelli TaxID=144512 RepID=A0A0V0TM68_9BILA|nr:hypothetical protein T05_14973 [Trichinella murrelli]
MHLLWDSRNGHYFCFMKVISFKNFPFGSNRPMSNRSHDVLPKTSISHSSYDAVIQILENEF